jgi:hypothetical protein
VPGLSDRSEGHLSFESVNLPGYYLRHASFDFVLGKNDASAALGNDATFRRVPGLADPAAVSFRSTNYPDRYLRDVGGRLKLERISGANAHREATFHVVD